MSRSPSRHRPTLHLVARMCKPNNEKQGSSGVWEFRSSGFQEFRSLGVWEFRSSRIVVRDLKLAPTLRYALPCRSPLTRLPPGLETHRVPRVLLAVYRFPLAQPIDHPPSTTYVSGRSVRRGRRARGPWELRITNSELRKKTAKRAAPNEPTEAQAQCREEGETNNRQ